MNGTSPTERSPHEQYPEAAEWLARTLRGLDAPFAVRESANELKAMLVAYLRVPNHRLQTLADQPAAAARRTTTVGTTCPTCGQPARVIANNETCPLCNRPMVIRNNRTTGQAFLGCSGYPACRGTYNLRELMLRRAPGNRTTGVTRVPGAPNEIDEPMRHIDIS